MSFIIMLLLVIQPLDTVDSELLSTKTSTIHVPADYSTIQEAIYAASSGDTILVAPGTYLENINFTGKDLVVQSEEGPETTVIDGGQSGSVVTFEYGEGAEARLTGFTLTNGLGQDGG